MISYFIFHFHTYVFEFNASIGKKILHTEFIFEITK